MLNVMLINNNKNNNNKYKHRLQIRAYESNAIVKNNCLWEVSFHQAALVN